MNGTRRGYERNLHSWPIVIVIVVACIVRNLWDRALGRI